MKTKRFLAGLLSFIMMFSMVGMVNVSAAETAENEWKLLDENLTSGTYTDDTAVADTEYEYIVVGSDGSMDTVSTDVMENLEIVYEKLTWTTGSFAYSMLEDGESYLIVGIQNDHVDDALKAEAALPHYYIAAYKDADGSTIRATSDAVSAELAACEWTIRVADSGTEGEYYICPTNSETTQYMQIQKATSPGTADSPAVDLTDTKSVSYIKVTTPFSGTNDSDDNYANSVYIGGMSTETTSSEGYINSRNDTHAGTWNSVGGGSCLYLYEKMYTVSETAISAITDVVGDTSGYTADSVADYDAALEAARASYETPEAAQAALEALQTAANDLVPMAWVGIVEVYYQQVIPTTSSDDDTTVQEVPSGDYLIVGSDTYANKAITTDTDLTYTDVVVNGDKITPINEALEWKFTWTGSGYTVESVDDAGFYLNFTDENTDDGVSIQEVDSPQSIQLNHLHGNGGVYVNTLHIGVALNELTYLNNRGNGIGSYNGWYSNSDHPFPDNGSSFFLYKETYGISADKINEATTGVGAEADYTTDSWTTYSEALTAANGGFDSAEEAYIAYAELLDAINDLVASDISDYITEAYVKVSPDSSAVQPVLDGVYVIAGAKNNSAKNKALNSDNTLTYTDISNLLILDGKRINTTNTAYEWRFVWSGTGYMISATDEADKYLMITNEDDPAGATIGSTIQMMQLAYFGGNNDADSVHIGGINTNANAPLGYLNHRNTNAAGTWNGDNGDDGTVDGFPDNGSTYYLYERLFVITQDELNAINEGVQEESVYAPDCWEAYQNALTAAQGGFETAAEAEAAHQALLTAKDNLKNIEDFLYETICTANGGEYVFDSSAYSEDAWNAYIAALDAAKASFTTDTVEALKTAVEGLEPVVDATYVDIGWQMTKDEVTNGTANYVSDLTYVNSSDHGVDYTGDGANDVVYSQYEALTWDWSDIEKLVSDQEMKISPVWSPADENSMSSALFNNKTGDDWKTANIYKISGEFTWPEGYDLHDTAVVLESANDYYYYDIYKYIRDNGFADLFDLNKVLPVNDDVYVVMWAGEESAKPTVDNVNDYLAFWSGTSGKGIWSENGRTNDDYGRTTPATFLSYNLQGERAYFKSYPNEIGTGAVKDDGSEYANTDVVSYNGNNNYYLEHTNYWYTMTDTLSVNSVLRNQYPDGIAAGTEVHIDLYVFNNSQKGVIDELNIQLIKEKEEYVDVTVEYYYGSVDEDGYLGEEHLLNHEPGDVINLAPGTVAGQLNSYKAEAIAVAANKSIANGVQLNPGFVVTADGPNVIQVLYIPEGQNVVILTADSADVYYTGAAQTLNEVTVQEAGYDTVVNTPADESTGAYTLPDGNTIENVYSVVSKTEPGIYANAFTTAAGETPTFVVKNAAGTEITGSYTIIKNPGELIIRTNTVEETYTYDFGVTNTYSDVLKTDAASSVAEACALSVTDDKDNVEVDLANNTLTYTPNGVNTGETVTLTLEYTGGYKVEKTINFIPASNVLYEEDDFGITADADETTEASWTTDGTAAAKTVTDNDSTVYGYAGAYNTTESYSNSAALKATLGLNDGTGIAGTTAKTLDAVTFTFTGTGFDLLSACGTNTGMLLVKVQDSSGEAYAHIVDTYFTGDGTYINSGEMVYQVPVIREMDLPYDTYTVTVYGYLVNTAGAMTATYSVEDSAPAVPVEDILMIALEDCGMSDIDTSEVEVTFMDDNSVLNGGTGNVYADTGIGTFALDEAAESDAAGTNAATDEAYVYLDGFRVYQPLGTEETAYADTEKGLKYASLFDFLQTSANDLSVLTNKTAVYIEYDGDLDVASVADYKNQGPENEVYLSPGNAIAFVVDNYESGNVVQVSAKAVTAGAVLGYATGDTSDDTINKTVSVSSTEMYYTVETVKDDYLGKNYVQITNTGTGLLAVSGVKLTSAIQPMASAGFGETVIENTAADASKFAPEKMTVSVPEEVTVNRTFSISISTSLDVDHLAIDLGDDEGKQELKATNTQAVAAKRAKVYKFSSAVLANAVGEFTCTLYAYDADGNESAPVDVTVKVVE